MPRKAEGQMPLTPAERQQRQRERKAARDALKDEALDRILLAKTLREAHQIAREARLKHSQKDQTK